MSGCTLTSVLALDSTSPSNNASADPPTTLIKQLDKQSFDQLTSPLANQSITNEQYQVRRRSSTGGGPSPRQSSSPVPNQSTSPATNDSHPMMKRRSSLSNSQPVSHSLTNQSTNGQTMYFSSTNQSPSQSMYGRSYSFSSPSLPSSRPVYISPTNPSLQQSIHQSIAGMVGGPRSRRTAPARSAAQSSTTHSADPADEYASSLDANFLIQTQPILQPTNRISPPCIERSLNQSIIHSGNQSLDISHNQPSPSGLPPRHRSRSSSSAIHSASQSTTQSPRQTSPINASPVHQSANRSLSPSTHREGAQLTAGRSSSNGGEPHHPTILLSANSQAISPSNSPSSAESNTYSVSRSISQSSNMSVSQSSNQSINSPSSPSYSSSNNQSVDQSFSQSISQSTSPSSSSYSSRPRRSSMPTHHQIHQQPPNRSHQQSNNQSGIASSQRVQQRSNKSDKIVLVADHSTSQSSKQSITLPPAVPLVQPSNQSVTPTYFDPTANQLYQAVDPHFSQQVANQPINQSVSHPMVYQNIIPTMSPSIPAITPVDTNKLLKVLLKTPVIHQSISLSTKQLLDQSINLALEYQSIKQLAYQSITHETLSLLRNTATSLSDVLVHLQSFNSIHRSFDTLIDCICAIEVAKTDQSYVSMIERKDLRDYLISDENTLFDCVIDQSSQSINHFNDIAVKRAIDRSNKPSQILQTFPVRVPPLTIDEVDQELATHPMDPSITQSADPPVKASLLLDQSIEKSMRIDQLMKQSGQFLDMAYKRSINQSSTQTINRPLQSIGSMSYHQLINQSTSQAVNQIISFMRRCNQFNYDWGLELTNSTDQSTNQSSSTSHTPLIKFRDLLTVFQFICMGLRPSVNLSINQFDSLMTFFYSPYSRSLFNQSTNPSFNPSIELAENAIPSFAAIEDDKSICKQITQSSDQSFSHSANQSVKPPVNPLLDPSINQPVDLSMLTPQSTDLSYLLFEGCGVEQSIGQLHTYQSINRSYQTINQLWPTVHISWRYNLSTTFDMRHALFVHLTRHTPGLLINQSMNPAIFQSINQSMKQSLNPLIVQSVNQAVSQLHIYDQATSQLNSQSMSLGGFSHEELDWLIVQSKGLHRARLHCSRLYRRSINHSINQSINQQPMSVISFDNVFDLQCAIYQSIDQTLNQSQLARLIDYFINSTLFDGLIDTIISQSANQSDNQSVDQSLDLSKHEIRHQIVAGFSANDFALLVNEFQSVNQSIDHSINQLIYHLDRYQSISRSFTSIVDLMIGLQLTLLSDAYSDNQSVNQLVKLFIQSNNLFDSSVRLELIDGPTYDRLIHQTINQPVSKSTKPKQSVNQSINKSTVERLIEKITLYDRLHRKFKSVDELIDCLIDSEKSGLHTAIDQRMRLMDWLLSADCKLFDQTTKQANNESEMHQLLDMIICIDVPSITQSVSQSAGQSVSRWSCRAINQSINSSSKSSSRSGKSSRSKDLNMLTNLLSNQSIDQSVDPVNHCINQLKNYHTLDLRFNNVAQLALTFNQSINQSTNPLINGGFAPKNQSIALLRYLASPECTLLNDALIDQSISQAIELINRQFSCEQSINQSAKQPANQSPSRFITQPITQSKDSSLHQSINQSINTVSSASLSLVDASLIDGLLMTGGGLLNTLKHLSRLNMAGRKFGGSVNQSINRSHSQALKALNNQSINQSISHPLNLSIIRLTDALRTARRRRLYYSDEVHQSTLKYFTSNQCKLFQVSQSAVKINQSLNQSSSSHVSIDSSSASSADESIDQSTDQSGELFSMEYPSFHSPNNQSTKQSTKQSVNQSITVSSRDLERMFRYGGTHQKTNQIIHQLNIANKRFRSVNQLMHMIKTIAAYDKDMKAQDDRKFRSINQSINQSISHSGWSSTQSMNSQSSSQSMSSQSNSYQSSSQSVNQSINQSINKSITPSMRQTIIGYLSSPSCLLFSDHVMPIRVTSAEIDRLIDCCMQAQNPSITRTTINQSITPQNNQLINQSIKDVVTTLKSLNEMGRRFPSVNDLITACSLHKSINQSDRKRLIDAMSYPQSIIFSINQSPIEVNEQDLCRLVLIGGSIDRLIDLLIGFSRVCRTFNSFTQLMYGLIESVHTGLSSKASERKVILDVLMHSKLFVKRPSLNDRLIDLLIKSAGSFARCVYQAQLCEERFLRFSSCGQLAAMITHMESLSPTPLEYATLTQLSIDEKNALVSLIGHQSLLIDGLDEHSMDIQSLEIDLFTSRIRIYRSVNQSSNQSTDQSINQSVSQVPHTYQALDTLNHSINVIMGCERMERRYQSFASMIWKVCKVSDHGESIRECEEFAMIPLSDTSNDGHIEGTINQSINQSIVKQAQVEGEMSQIDNQSMTQSTELSTDSSIMHSKMHQFPGNVQATADGFIIHR